MRLLSLVFLEQHFDLKEVTFCCSRKCGDEKIDILLLPSLGKFRKKYKYKYITRPDTNIKL